MRMITKRKIIVITTKGCYGCEIMCRMIRQIVESADNKITLEITDVSDCTNDVKQIIKREDITDFPTAIMFKNDTLVAKQVGTCTLAKLRKLVSNCL